jgi:hypothetical protein
MAELATGAIERFGVRGVTLVHRLGRLQIGETSVLIVVASAHRGAAFEACRWLIDTLKKTVPIWKKETFVDGAVWADGEPFPPELGIRDAAARGGRGHEGSCLRCCFAAVRFLASQTVLCADAGSAQDACRLLPRVAQDNGYVLKVNVKLVNVFTNVTDATGAIVGGLTKEDFSVTEDGRPQRSPSLSGSRSCR